VRRAIGVVAGVALILALSFAVVAAAGLEIFNEHLDLGQQLMLRLFGETSDSSASFAAIHGDRMGESPLRELALQAQGPGAKPYFSSDVGAAFAEDRLTMGDLTADQPSYFGESARFVTAPTELSFVAPSPLNDEAVTVLSSSAFFTAAYKPEPPEPNISPAPGTLAFAPPEVHALDFLPTAQVGAVRFDGHDATAVQPPQLGTRDASYGAGANVDVRAGKRSLNLNLSSEYEHLETADSSFSTSALGSSGDLTELGAPFLVPDDSQLNRLSLGAGVSVPVVHGLTLNLNYGAQRLYGAYGFPGFMNLDTINNTYGGKLTFDLPRLSSSLSISAYQDRFEDSLLPINGSTQTREDVNFTVKF
jgi:hypothetical protein